MDAISRIFKNTIWLSIATVIVQMISAVISIILARCLGKTVFGQYATVIAYVSLFTAFCQTGMSYLTVREGSRRREETSLYLGNTLAITFVIAPVIYMLMIYISRFCGYESNVVKLISVLGISMIISMSHPAFSSVFQIHQRLDLQGLFNVASSLLRLVLYAVVIFVGWGLAQIIYAHLITSVIITMLITIVILQFEKPRVKIRQMPSMLKESYIFGLSAIFTFIYFQIDIFMLSVMKTPEEVGLYAVAYKLVVLANELPIILLNYTLLPIMYKLFVDNKEKLERVYKISSRYMVLLGIPLGIGVFLLASPLVNLLFGAQYSQAAGALKILCWAISARFFAAAIGTVLTATDKMVMKVKTQGGLALLNVLLNLILIPRYSFIGASIATLITEISLVMIYFIYASKTFYRLSLFKDINFPAVLFSSVSMGIFLYIIKNTLNMFITIPLAMALYFLSLLLLRYFNDDDRLVASKILRLKTI